MSQDYEQLGIFEDEPVDEERPYRPLMAFPREAASPAPFIKRMWLRNFKGFRDLTVEFGDFNVLVGVNNCGKSTVLQAVDLCFRLMQFHAEFRRGVLVTPRAGKRVLDEMLPVAEPRDLWLRRRIRLGNTRVPITIGMELKEGLEFEFQVRRLWGGTNSRVSRIPDNLDESRMRGFLARRPVLVPASVGVVSREELRTPARLELLSLTGHHNEVLRNYLHELSARDVGLFQALQRELVRHFDGTVGPVEFDRQSDQYIAVKYREGETEHDIFSAGGGFLQVLQVLTYLYLDAPGIVLLDEPDAHLHSSVQRLVVDLLDGLSKRQRLQVVMATHSKEIINYVDASYILPISRDSRSARPLQHHASVLPILQDLGAIDNVDLAALIASKRCVFVEGSSDRQLLARFAAKMGSTVFEGQSQVVVIPTKGVDHPELDINIGILEEVVEKPLKSVVIRDRDGLPDDLIQQICARADTQHRQIVVLGRTEIENYLLAPCAIWRVILEELRRRGEEGEQLPSQEEVTAQIEQAVDSLQDETLDSISTHINQHSIRYHDKHLDVRTTNTQARAFLQSRWGTLEGKLSIVLGKDALKAIRRGVHEQWGVSFGNIRLVEAMTTEEIHPDITNIIKTLEAL